MISFYNPNKEKYKIIIDAPSFPSDKYAVQAHLKLHDLDPNKNLIEINTIKNEKTYLGFRPYSYSARN